MGDLYMLVNGRVSKYIYQPFHIFLRYMLAIFLSFWKQSLAWKALGGSFLPEITRIVNFAFHSPAINIFRANKQKN